MGFDVERFTDFDGEVYADLVCCICTGILENAVSTECEHFFCSHCLSLWMGSSETCQCPICNLIVVKDTLKPIPRIARNFLNNLNIHCNYRKRGCDVVVRLELLGNHLLQCQFRNNDTKEGKALNSPTSTSQLPSHDDQDEIRDQTNTDHFQPFLRCCASMWAGIKCCGNCFISGGIFCGSCTNTLFTNCSLGFQRFWNTPQIVSKLLHVLVTMFLTVLVTLGVVFRNDCQYYPILPIMLIAIGITCGAITVFHFCQKHISRFADNKCRIIQYLLIVAAIELLFLAIVIYHIFIVSLKWIPDVNCEQGLLVLCFWSLNILIVSLVAYLSYVYLLRKCCVYLFE